MAATIHIRAEYVDVIMETLDIETDAELATRIGVNRTTLHRALAGNPVGSQLIAGALTAFPDVTFDDMFSIAE